MIYSIALRFTEKFAPEKGTIKAHQELINSNGFVWYGKMGTPVSDANIVKVMAQDTPKILLIHSGGQDRYWAYITDIKKEQPAIEEFPEYYRDIALEFKTWFCVYRFEMAEKSVMSKCRVSSSKAILSNASRHSMSPYFLIEIEE